MEARGTQAYADGAWSKRGMMRRSFVIAIVDNRQVRLHKWIRLLSSDKSFEFGSSRDHDAGPGYGRSRRGMWRARRRGARLAAYSIEEEPRRDEARVHDELLHTPQVGSDRLRDTCKARPARRDFGDLGGGRGVAWLRKLHIQRRGTGAVRWRLSKRLRATSSLGGVRCATARWARLRCD